MTEDTSPTKEFLMQQLITLLKKYMEQKRELERLRRP